jgi:hypothetical protein
MSLHLTGVILFTVLTLKAETINSSQTMIQENELKKEIAHYRGSFRINTELIVKRHEKYLTYGIQRK